MRAPVPEAFNDVRNPSSGAWSPDPPETWLGRQPKAFSMADWSPVLLQGLLMKT